MFPTIYHFIQDIFGSAPGFLKVINTFGFFVALSIGGAFWAMQTELKRLTFQGKLKPVSIIQTIGKPLGVTYYISQVFFGFIFGYKIIFLLIESQNGANPQELIFSLDGSWFWGILIMALILGYSFYLDKKQRLAEPQKSTIETDASVYMGTITTIALISGFLGAKVFHILENFNAFSIDYVMDNLFSTGGWTYYGGLICGATGVLVYCRKKGLNILSVLDSGAAPMMLAYGLGRFGCHFSGDGDWGVPNPSPKPFALPDWLWSYSYPNNVLGMEGYTHEGMKKIDGCTGDFCYELINPVWPTPIYEALMAIGLFLIIWLVLRKRVVKRGNLFAFYMLFAGIERFIIEFIREHGDSVYKAFGIVFSQAQMISLLLILGGISWFIFGSGKKQTKKTAQHLE
jgi:prolipoprotein diacylglyceryl transferase